MPTLRLPQVPDAQPVRRRIIPGGQDLIAREAEKAAGLFQGVFEKVSEEVQLRGARERRKAEQAADKLTRQAEIRDERLATQARRNAFTKTQAAFEAKLNELQSRPAAEVTQDIVQSELGAVLDQAAGGFTDELGQAQFQGLRESLELGFPAISQAFRDEVAKEQAAREAQLAKIATNNQIVRGTVGLKIGAESLLSELEDFEDAELNPENVMQRLMGVLNGVMDEMTDEDARLLFQDEADTFMQQLPGLAAAATEQERQRRASREIGDALGDLRRGATFDNYQERLGDLAELLTLYEDDLDEDQRQAIETRESASIALSAAQRGLDRTPLAAAERIFRGEISYLFKTEGQIRELEALERHAASKVTNHVLSLGTEIRSFARGLSSVDIDEAARRHGSTAVGNELLALAEGDQLEKVDDYRRLLKDPTVVRAMPGEAQRNLLDLEAAETAAEIVRRGVLREQGIAHREEKVRGGGRRNAAHVEAIEAADATNSKLRAQFAGWSAEMDRIAQMGPAGTSIDLVLPSGLPTGGSIEQVDDRDKLMGAVSNQIAAAFLQSTRNAGFVSTPWKNYMRQMIDVDENAVGAAERLRAAVNSIGVAMETMNGALVSPADKSRVRSAMSEFLTDDEFAWIYAAYRGGGDARSILAARQNARDKDRQDTLSQSFDGALKRMNEGEKGFRDRVLDFIEDDLPDVDRDLVPDGFINQVMSDTRLHYRVNNGVLPMAVESAYQKAFGAGWTEENGMMIRGGPSAFGEWARDQINERVSTLTGEDNEPLSYEKIIPIPVSSFPTRGAVPEGFDPKSTFILMHNDGTFRPVLDEQQETLYFQVDWATSRDGIEAKNLSSISHAERVRESQGRTSIAREIEQLGTGFGRGDLLKGLDRLANPPFGIGKITGKDRDLLKDQFRVLREVNSGTAELKRKMSRGEINADDALKTIEILRKKRQGIIDVMERLKRGKDD